MQSHYGEELWGACTSPNSDEFVTCGADKTVRLWDITTNTMKLSTPPLENDVRAVHWS